MSLLWHPKPTSDKPQPKPRCVNTWIERGTYLINQSFIHPKLMWKPAYEPDLATKRQINVEAEQIDLLHVSRINDVEQVDRRRYPFARCRRCFIVETRSDAYLFEAGSATEKENLVFGLKLLVARLASLLMVRDFRAIEEFFEPIDIGVPGAAPEWTQKHPNES